MSLVLTAPPKASRTGGQKYWIGLLSEAGELPIPRVPQSKKAVFRLDQPFPEGVIAFIGLYATPTGDSLEEIVEIGFVVPAYPRGGLLTIRF